MQDVVGMEFLSDEAEVDLDAAKHEAGMSRHDGRAAGPVTGP